MMDMQMMNMPMMNMPMMNMPMPKLDDNKDLKVLSPEIYIKIYPMVAHHCDMMVARYGTMYCPSKDEMDHISEKLCDKYEEDHRYNDEDEDYDDDYNYDNVASDTDMRQRRRRRRRRGRRNTVQDLIKILLIGELVGRRGRSPIYNYGY
jgi:hypothetical protein